MILKSISVLLLASLVVSGEVRVNTTSGVVRGLSYSVLNQTVNQFLGIPFAEPPIGDLRFAKPKPIAKPLSGEINATVKKHSCVQNGPDTPISEDCLVLNVYTTTLMNTSTGKLKPVMFWIYGGGLNWGSIFSNGYNGSVLATQDVVFVAVNYRLGTFGFLYGGEESAPGNMGFYDQILGLKWVRDNIHLFGGDKNQVTIFGESAGSWSVSVLLLSPEANGLFKRAILQSGADMFNKDRPVASKEEALNEFKQIADHFNCKDEKTRLSCLKKVDAKDLLGYGFDKSHPLEGTQLLPYGAQKAFQLKKFNKDLDVIAGVNKDEGSLAGDLNEHLTKQDFINFITENSERFHNIDVQKMSDYYFAGVNQSDSNAIKWAIYNFYGDLLIKCPTYKFAKGYAEHSDNNQTVFFYELTYSDRSADELKKKGITHGTDLDFMFGLSFAHGINNNVNVQFSKEVVDYWISFAKTGKPISWKPLLTTTSSVSHIVKDLKPNSKDSYNENLFSKTCDGLWNNWF